ncbi:MAG: glycosyltransferase [Negativicutes bacterium]|nr:glycosyltransferase [Negativicutes bacterium]
MQPSKRLSFPMLQNNYIPRISFVTGIVNPGDAISETLIADILALDRLSFNQRRNLDAQVYCRESSHQDTRINVVSDWRDVLSDEHFRTSDLYYFHYGIFSDMHRLMHHVRRDAKLVVFFHNVTQPQYCPIEEESLIHASYQQIRNFRTADFIVAASGFSARQIAGYDLGKAIKVVPLFGPNAPESPPDRAPIIDTTRPLRLLTCGRFVRSKGAALLLAALDQIDASPARPIELTLAGQTQFSDARYIKSLGELAARLKPDISVKFAFDLAPEAIRPLFADADAFVLPSLHEGFGMTVAEALIADTPVICSDAGALPEVSGGYGLTFPAGDVAALASALQAFASAQSAGMILCDRGPLPPADWHKQMAGHAQTYLRGKYIERMIGEFDALLQPTPSWNESARHALADADMFEPGSTLTSRFDRAVLEALVNRQIANPIGDAEAKTRKGEPAVSQGRRSANANHIADTLCVDLHIEALAKWPKWLRPSILNRTRSARHLAAYLGKRTYTLFRLIAHAKAARNRKNWSEACAIYTKALEIRPNLGLIWVQLGHALKESGALIEAGQAYGHAEKLLPNNSDLQLQIGHLKKISGNVSDAMFYYRRALFYDPRNSNAAQELVHLGQSDDVVRIRMYHGFFS